MTGKASFHGRVSPASLRRVTRALVSEPGRVSRGLKAHLVNSGNDWLGEMQSRWGSTGDGLHVRSGRLRGSLAKEIKGDTLTTLKLRLVSRGADLRYARIQEYGGVITPKTKRFLTIPTSYTKTPAGRPKGAFAGGAGAFISAHPGETFFLRTKGSLLLMWKKSKRTVIALWSLVKKVEIPGPRAPTKKRASRLGFFDTWEKLGRKRHTDLARLARNLSKRSA